MIIRSATISPGPRARTSSRWAEAGPSTRRSRTSSRKPRGNSFDGSSKPADSMPSNYRAVWTLPTSCSGYAATIRNRDSRTRPLEAISPAAYIQDNWRATNRLTLNLACAGMEFRTPMKPTTAWRTSIPTSTTRPTLPILVPGTDDTSDCSHQPRLGHQSRSRSWRAISSI